MDPSNQRHLLASLPPPFCSFQRKQPGRLEHTILRIKSASALLYQAYSSKQSPDRHVMSNENSRF